MAKSGLKLSRDAEGVPHATWGEAPLRGEYLVRFLEADVAEDTTYLERLLSEGKAVLNGKSKSFRISGNAFGVNLTPKNATLRPLADDEAKPFTLPLADFLKILQRWGKLIREQ